MPGSALRHSALVLAAGSSSRLGRAKQLVRVDGEPLLRRTVGAALATAPVRTVVVLGADAAAAAATVADLPVECVACPGWTEGMGASLRCGLAQLEASPHAVLVCVCDQPALDAAHLQALVAAWRAAPACAIASAYAGVNGVPALFPSGWFDALAALRGDTGARALLRARTEDVIAIRNESLARDIDVPEDLAPP